MVWWGARERQWRRAAAAVVAEYDFRGPVVMHKEPMVVVGGVVIATAIVTGMIAVFASSEATAIITIIVGFAGMGIMQLKAMADAKHAATHAKTAVTVAENTRTETVNLGMKLDEGNKAMQELELKINSNMERALISAEKSGIAKGLEQARTGKVQS